VLLDVEEGSLMIEVLDLWYMSHMEYRGWKSCTEVQELLDY
jgi:hypothetical protein